MQFLLSSTSLNGNASFNRNLLSALTNGTVKQTAAVKSVFVKKNLSKQKRSGKNAKWQRILDGSDALRFEELGDILKALKARGFGVHTEKFNPKGKSDSPFSQKEFYSFLESNADIAGDLQTQLDELRQKVKSEKGWLSKTFSVFSSEKPLEKVTNDVLAFEKYCRKHGVTFDDVNQALTGGDRENPVWTKLKDFRFLAAAVGGTLLGLAGSMGGVDLLSYAPQIVNDIPGLFFQGLPYVALPFIALSIHRAFSEKSLLKEAPTLARFAGTMSIGILIGLGVTAAMSGILPQIDPETIKETVGAAIGASGEQPFSPSQYILHGIGAAAIFASLYRLTKKKKPDANAAANPNAQTESALSTLFNKTSGAVSGAVNSAGKILDKAADGMDVVFHKYMNYVGIPAITLMMTGLINKGGLSELANYGGYYAVMGGTIIACSAVIGGLAYAQGARKEEMAEMLKTGTTAFSISSSAATMPVTKEGLKKMGVPSRIRESVVPLGANFNMMGTAMFLGGTAVSATYMLGLEPTFGQTLSAMFVAVATAFGAPGAPASMIIFLDPVLSKIGLNPAQAAEIYKMVIPGERLLDMSQTALNVSGDQIVALNTEAWEKNKGWRKLIPFKREHPLRDAIPAPGV